MTARPMRTQAGATDERWDSTAGARRHTLTQPWDAGKDRIMTETVTVRGFLGSDVRHVITEKGLPISTFRVGSTPRRFDRERGEWVDGDTNWFTVTCFRALAQNVQSTLSKGDPVVVSGRLRIRQYEKESGVRGTAVEVDADGVGHDLSFGTGSFTRISGGGRDSRAASESAVTEDGPGTEDQRTSRESGGSTEPSSAWGEPAAVSDSPAPAF